jgi:hypothetical protein
MTFMCPSSVSPVRIYTTNIKAAMQKIILTEPDPNFAGFLIKSKSGNFRAVSVVVSKVSP